jgi:Lrp/AsnC family transcriptional regulator, regulator for asnA, asnC and gidA
MLNPKDKKILNILLDNSRLSFREVAKKAKVSVVTVIKRVKELEKKKILKSYTTELDYEQLGYDVEAIIMLQIDKGKLFEVERKLAHDNNVFAVYDTTGDYDSMVIAKFKNRKSLDLFLKKIQRYDFVKKTKTKLVLNTIKERQIKVE